MRFTIIPTLLSLIVGIGLVSAHIGPTVLKPRRTTSILNSPEGQPVLPSAPQASQAAAAVGLNLDDIQGDILVGMKKRQELFFFFSITNAANFKKNLKSKIHDKITTTTQLLDISKQPKTAVNIAFSQTGLRALGVSDSLGDEFFARGQFNDSDSLGDPGTGHWEKAFAGTSIHGVFLLASDSVGNLIAELAAIQLILLGSITEKHRLFGSARPGNQEGHEHFGFLDGISQPAVKGFTKSPNPGQTLIDPGRFLFGEDGDKTTRPDWAKDGSLLAFRQLEQLVPEFNKFLTDNPIPHPQLTKQQGSELLGARMVGRWKSGAPVDLAPLFDDPVLAADPNRNNNFTFAHPNEDIQTNQTRCPFSAHIRKTRPRADFHVPDTEHHIIRAGIPYGPEVSLPENLLHKTLLERGLAFVSYQSDLDEGFRELQEDWANNPKFLPHTADSTPGVDPIIGALHGAPRVVSGLDSTDPTHDLTMGDFIVSRGGEYFFSPSLSAIAGKLST